MPYTDKTKPAPHWTPEQLYIWHERLAIMGDGGTDRLLNSHYVEAWNQADKTKTEAEK